MKVYRGTPNKSPLIRKGADVSSMFERSVKYARYPNNGLGVEIGFVFQLSVDESDVDWECLDDCPPQGKLKRDVMAEAMTVCDVKLDLASREGPTKQYGLTKPSVWADGRKIVWKPIESEILAS